MWIRTVVFMGVLAAISGVSGGCRHADTGLSTTAAAPQSTEVDRGTEIDREQLKQALAQWHASYDANAQMLVDTLERVTYRYHTTMEEGVVHPTRNSLWYALALLDTGDEALRERAISILRRVLPLQDQNPESDYYGVWSYYLEEPITQMDPPDRNWADFNGVTLLQMMYDHEDRLPADLRAEVDSALARAATAIRRRDVGPGYTNIAIMGTFMTLGVADRLDDADLYAYGMERLRRFYDFTKENGNGFAEYNSPTYTVVALKELGRMRQYIRDPEAQPLIEEIYRWGWEEIAYHFHPPTGQWAGPHSRSYRTLLRDDVPLLIQRASGGRVDFELPQEVDLRENGYRIPLPIPPDLESSFTTLDAPHTLIRSLPKANVVGTTYLHPAFTLGTVDQGDFWNQRRSVVAYWGTRKAPSYLHVRFLHDGYDFASARIAAVQRKGDVLAGINIATDGGDRHPSLDRIQDGKIRARDLRVRFEFGGAAAHSKPAQPESLQDPVRLDYGDVQVQLAVPYAAFDGMSPYWESGMDEGATWLDIVLYHGEQRTIDLAALEEAVVGAALRMSAEDAPAPQVRATTEGGRLEMEWDDLQLSLPIRPAEASVLREAVHRIPVADAPH